MKALIGDQPEGEMIDLSPEDCEAMLALAFLQVTKPLMDYLKRKRIEGPEADRWGRVTRIVYWKYLQRMEAGMAVWALVTAGIIAGQPKLEDKG